MNFQNQSYVFTEKKWKPTDKSSPWMFITLYLYSFIAPNWNQACVLYRTMDLKIVVCFAMEYYFTVKQNEPLLTQKTWVNFKNRWKKPDIKGYTSISMNYSNRQNSAWKENSCYGERKSD